MELKFNVAESDIPLPVGMLFAGQRAATNFACFDLVSRALLDNPNVSAIVEFGTYAGTMTMYLGLWGLRLGVPVHTFDIEPGVSKDVHRVLDGLGVQCHWQDVFSKDSMRLVCDILKKPGYLFIDGGDKQRELNTYAPILPTGTLFSVHDWGTEIHSLTCDVMWEYTEQYRWMHYNAQLATVRKIGIGSEHYRQTTDEDIAKIQAKWIEVIGEETRT